MSYFPEQNVLVTVGTFDDAASTTEIQLSNGRLIRIPTATLIQAETVQADGAGSSFEMVEPDFTVIPLVEEQLRTGKRVVQTGKVRLRKVVDEYETALDETLALRTFDVERVQLNAPVESAPGIRHEGTTTVYPVVEEQLILTRQLVLKEEIRVTQRDAERHDTRPVVLRRERIEVEREQTIADGQNQS